MKLWYNKFLLIWWLLTVLKDKSLKNVDDKAMSSSTWLYSWDSVTNRVSHRVINCNHCGPSTLRSLSSNETCVFLSSYFELSLSSTIEQPLVSLSCPFFVFNIHKSYLMNHFLDSGVLKKRVFDFFIRWVCGIWIHIWNVNNFRKGLRFHKPSGDGLLLIFHGSKKRQEKRRIWGKKNKVWNVMNLL